MFDHRVREFNFEVRDLFKTTKSFSCDVWIKYSGHITKLPIEVQVRKESSYNTFDVWPASKLYFNFKRKTVKWPLHIAFWPFTNKNRERQRIVIMRFVFIFSCRELLVDKS